MIEIHIVSGKLKTTPSFSPEHQSQWTEFLTWAQQKPDRCSAWSELLGILEFGLFCLCGFSLSFFSSFISFSPLRGNYETETLEY